MKKYFVHDLIQILGAQIISQGKQDQSIEQVEIDSRYVRNPANSLFFALDGSHTRGHYYIPALIEQGVLVFITHADPEPVDGVWILKVKDALRSLQQLASYHRSLFKLPVIGITGSNGKTLTKEWLTQILGTELSVCKNPKSYNSQLGVALSVLELEAKHQIAVFEAGISERGEMEYLEKMIKPVIGIFTNIGDAHDSGFLHRMDKIREKSKLFQNCKKIILCGDYPDLLDAFDEKADVISWGSGSHNKIQTHWKIETASGLTVLQLQWSGKAMKFVLPFQDSASLENATHAIIVSLYCEIPETNIQQVLSRLQGLKLRLEQKEGLHGCILINDSYSLDLKSLELALRFMDRQNKELSRCLVISDFAQREHDAELIREITQLCRQFRIRRLVVIGDKLSALQKSLSDTVKFHRFETTDALLESTESIGFHQECILIKGARQFALERFFQAFALSRHDTILEINLAAIAHNVMVYKKMLAEGTKIMAVVKASAYGSGQYEVARYLEHRGVDFLAVAYPDEGLLLRKKNIHSRIMVMNTAHADFEELLDFKLEPEIFSLDQFDRMLHQVGDQSMEIHIKLESGMNRLGFPDYEMLGLKERLSTIKNIRVASIFSHLSASGDEQFDDFSKQQFAVFRQKYESLCETLSYRPIAHILNSGGIARHREMQMDMVRLGIGLYGMDADPQIQSELETVHTLKTRISQIKILGPGESVSYNRSGLLKARSRIGVLSMGYADGLPRIAGSRKYQVWIKDRLVPLVGVVCMDMCMVDLSDLEQVDAGDEVEIFGKHANIHNLSELCDSIPYEILCGISPRVKRVYFE